MNTCEKIGSAGFGFTPCLRSNFFLLISSCLTSFDDHGLPRPVVIKASDHSHVETMPSAVKNTDEPDLATIAVPTTGLGFGLVW